MVSNPKIFRTGPLALLIVLFFSGSVSAAQSPPGAQASPVRVAPVAERTVSEQISLVGTAEAIAETTVASETSGIVEAFPVREGDSVKIGDLLARIRSTELKIRIKAARAARDKIMANLQLAEKELARASRLKEADSIAARNYDEAFYNSRSLQQEILSREAEIDRLEYELKQKTVTAPLSGFVAVEHTQVGEWINPGGSVVTLLDLSQVRITVDVPERYAVMLSPNSEVRILVRSVSGNPLSGRIHAVLPKGDPAARTFPVRIYLPNPEARVKSGMEAVVTFSLSRTRNAMMVPKDAVVSRGADRLVYRVVDGKAVPVPIGVLGYYDADVAVEGGLKPGENVVVRGNERLMPGQPVRVTE